MEGEKDIKSVLILDKLVFDRIEFKRFGMKNDNEIVFELQGMVRKKQDIYKVTLNLNGKKEEEYMLDISVSGYFSFDEHAKLSDEQQESLLQKNAVAIVMPYLRSEVSLLTAQPEVDCVVIPPFNINKMMDQSE